MPTDTTEPPQERLRLLCTEAIERFGTSCFWSAKREALRPEAIIAGLRLNGGHSGLRLAYRIEEALRAADGAPDRSPASPRG